MQRLMTEAQIQSSDSTKCPACTHGLKAWFTKSTTYGDFQFRRCQQCRSAFVLPRPTEAVLANFYEDPDRYQSPHGDDLPDEHDLRAVDAERIVQRIQQYTASGRMLDVGAGDGLYAKAALAHGYQVDALEPNENACEIYERVTGQACEVGFLDEAITKARTGQYDVVLLSQVMEHLPDPETAMRQIRRLLKPGGTLVIGVPRFRSALSILMGRRDIFINPPEHLNHFTPKGLSHLGSRYSLTMNTWETATWYEPDRVAKRLHAPGANFLVHTAVPGFFKVADKKGLGNTLEMYFKAI